MFVSLGAIGLRICDIHHLEIQSELHGRASIVVHFVNRAGNPCQFICESFADRASATNRLEHFVALLSKAETAAAAAIARSKVEIEAAAAIAKTETQEAATKASKTQDAFSTMINDEKKG